jgi:ATP-dependent helicase Lhr and Lhr-like helicase
VGLICSDSFGGLRALLTPGERKRRSGRRRRGFGLEGAGRWALAWPNRFKQNQAAPNRGECVEHMARTLLRRYGVVFLRMLEREATWLPKWRDLLRVYRRLEARGEIRGGRFVAGFSGEQLRCLRPLANFVMCDGRRRRAPWSRCLAPILSILPVF